MEINIGGHLIGEDHPPYLIAEAGINHQGYTDIARKLIYNARAALADAIKFQCHIPDAEMLRDEMPEDVYETISRYSLDEDEDAEIMTYCAAVGITYLSTPFSVQAVERLERLGVCAYKIGSGEVSNVPLLRAVAQTGKPVILSTGMHSLAEVRKAVDTLWAVYSSLDILLMHCTSAYPTQPSDARLQAIGDLRDYCYGLPVGLSDHSEGNAVSIAAVALGAVAIERHFTVSRKWTGPDHAISLELSDMIALRAGTDAAWIAVKGDKSYPVEEESTVAQWARHSLVAIKDIAEGEEYTSENIAAKRPGSGNVPASEWDDTIGDVAPSATKAGEFLPW